jgi:hypothetical protein
LFLAHEADADRWVSRRGTASWIVAQQEAEEVLASKGILRIGGGREVGLGFGHGSVLRPRIHQLLESAEVSLKKQVLGKGAGIALLPLAVQTGLTANDLVVPVLIRAARRLQRHIPAEYLDEMEGIAEGAGVPYDAILLENTFLTLAEQTDPAALLSSGPRCTNLVAFGEATSMGQLLHASTLDWGMKEVLKDRTVCLVMEPATGHPFVSVTWPGMVGTLRAMGAQGIAITEESCAAKDDTGMDGMPVNFLMRSVVQHASDLDDAVKRVREAPGTCGYKITISDGRRLDARAIEVTARHSHVRKPVEGLLFGCDPEAGPECFDGACDPAIPRNDASSARRYPAVRALLEQGKGRLRAPLVSTSLQDRAGGVFNDGTLLACVFEPQTLRFHVSLGDDVDTEGGQFLWDSHDLLPLLSEERRSRYGIPWPVDTTSTFEREGEPVTLGGVEIRRIAFDSPAPSGHAFNDRIHAVLYWPKEPIGCVIQLPSWKESTLAGQSLLAMRFAKERVAVFVMPLPYQVDRAAPGVGSGRWTLSANLARTRQAMLQGAADVMRASLWIERDLGIRPIRQGVMGVSLGGHVAALAFGAYKERFGAGAFVLTGAHVERSFMGENRTTAGVRKVLLERGVTAEEALALVGPIDPGRFAESWRRDQVLLVGAKADDVVLPEGVRDLAAAYGGARIEWVEGDHYGILSQLGTVIQTVLDHWKATLGGP